MVLILPSRVSLSVDLSAIRLCPTESSASERSLKSLWMEVVKMRVWPAGFEEVRPRRSVGCTHHEEHRVFPLISPAHNGGCIAIKGNPSDRMAMSGAAHRDSIGTQSKCASPLRSVQLMELCQRIGQWVGSNGPGSPEDLISTASQIHGGWLDEARSFGNFSPPPRCNPV